MTGLPLPSSAPSAQGVDARGLLALLDAVEAEGVELHSLAVARHGHVVAAGWWAPYAADQRPLVYSLSKSLTATAVGFLVDEGLVSVEDRVVDLLGVAASVDPAWSAVRVRHALSMTLGHAEESLFGAYEAAERIGGDDALLAGILATPPERAPGAVFAYNQPATYLLARIVEATAGVPVSEVLRTRLLEPLGLPPVGWEQDEAGHELGFSGAHVPTATILALAQLYLADGVLGGRRYLSSEWVAAATVGQGPPRLDGETKPDWTCGYGWSFWQARHGYRGDGAFGQYAVVLPRQDVAIAITSETEDMQRVLDLLWEHLLPAVSEGASVSAEADRALAARLAGLALPALGSDAGPSGRPDHATFRRSLPAGLREPDLAIAVDRVDDGWLLGVDRGDQRYAVRCGDGVWLTSRMAVGSGELLVAASGGWCPDGRFRARIRLLDSPHTLVVDGDPATGAGRMGWRAVPLFGENLDRLVVT